MLLPSRTRSVCSSVLSLRRSCPPKNPLPHSTRLCGRPWILRQPHLDVRQEIEPRRQRQLLSFSADEDRKLSSLRSVRVLRAELFQPRRISRADSADGEKDIARLDTCCVRRA